MGRHDDSEDEGSRCCCELLASWFPGLRRPPQHRPSRDESIYSTRSSASSKGAGSDAVDEDDESRSFDEFGPIRFGSWNSMGDLMSTATSESEAPSVESDPQERARRAATSFLKWKDKEYVPLSYDEKRAIKEYRKAIAQEEGSYTSTRAQRPPDGTSRQVTSRAEECVPLDDSTDGCTLVRRRSSQIRFTAAVVASRAVDVHNDALVVRGAGEEVPALPRSASILRSSSVTRSTEEPPVFTGGSEKGLPDEAEE
ncbi:hypothetical protein LSCM1_01593 [Leishmania martiniquensis]|uniref:Uncharacterized protein n=1 Tax=Leishmania martiniquensis TaxID=1580590 RepID=A0A836KI25_9TRYP|nr:hypothetical protein LSCM1_01593 [Leishmania martiniquensis]